MFFQSDSAIICIKDTVRITDISIVPESCTNINDGSISIAIEYAGEDPVVWWFYPNGRQVDPNREDPLKINNLTAGEYLLLISTPEGFIRDTLVVPLSPFNPNLNAGEDLPISCQRNAAEVTGVFDNINIGYKNFWKDINGDVVSEQPKATITSPGTYYFELVLDSTGCAYRDTLEVLPKFVPTININGDSTIFCLDSVQLNAEIIPSVGNNSITDWFWYDSNPATNPPSIASGESVTLGEAGVYYLRGITDENCQGIDTFNLKEGRIYPTADGGVDTTIVCGETITLNSSNSAANSNLGQLAIEWILIDSSLEFGSNTIVEQPGMVVLKVTDDFNQCASFDTINILPAPDYPFLNFNFEAKDPSGIQLDCNTDDYNLMTSGFNVNLFDYNWDVDNLNGISSTATLNPTFTEGGYNPEVILSGVIEGAREDYALKWYRQSNLIEEVLLDIQVAEAGEYTLEITDVNTYCKADTTIFIDKNIEYPIIAAISSEETLDCNKDEVRLGILEPSPILVPSFQLDWSAPEQSDYSIDPSDSLAIFTSTAGTYTVTLTNAINGCSAMKDIEVIENRDYPTAEISAPDVLTCADSIVELRAAFSLDGATNKYAWNNLNPLGQAPKAGEGSITEVIEPGQYILTVLNPSNQCTSYDTVTVVQDVQQPQVQIATPEILTCTNNSVLLLATVTNVSGAYNSFWSGLEGQSLESTDNQDIVNVSEMGNYELRVVSTANGCSTLSLVTVESDNNFPVARVAESVILPCKGTPVTLSNVESSEGDNFSYQWMVVSADGDLSNPTVLEPNVTLPGRYALTVSNTLNGCSAMDTVEVVLDPSLILASTGDDVKICEDFYELSANLPANTFGRWVPIETAAVLLTPEEPTTQVQTLQEGANLFEWILSTASCADYSSDTIDIFVAETPVASDDGTTLVDGNTEMTLALLDNDIFDADYLSTAIYTNPVEGTVTLDPNGEATYRVRSGFFGEDQFAYILCNEFCENRCDTALVFIDIPFDPNYEAPPLPNAITPNGDGLNDAFVFEILENPDKIYPDNELIVFNRWGDIVYTQRPYDNNWRGTAADGKELPHGTYYYVLRLDISEGIILKGDITIIRKN
jgi:gliding motility-associated-like protein